MASAGEFREGTRTFGMAPANPYGVNQFKQNKQTYDPDLAAMDSPSPKFQADEFRASDRPSAGWNPPSPPDSTPTRKFGEPEKSDSRFNKETQPMKFDFGQSSEKLPGRQTQRLPLAGRSLKQNLQPQTVDLLDTQAESAA